MKKILSCLLTILMLGFVAAPLSAQNTLTVADGSSTNSYIPIYGTWADADQHNQVIYPESMLGDMVSGQISSMTFYLTSTPTWTHSVTVSLGIATADHFSSATHDNASVTQVFTGNLNVSNNQMTFTFDTPYDYNGGDLLFDLTLVGGSWSSAYFNGTSSTGGSLYQYNSNTNTQNFIPKTTFAYSGGALCKTPSNVTASGITTSEATISWHGDENASSYNIQYMLSSETDWENAMTTTAYDTSVTLYNLQPSSTYKVRVQTDCSDNTQTVWSAASTFQTSCDLITITDLWFEDFEGYTGSGEQPFVCWATPVTTPGGGPFVYCGYGPSCHSGVNSAELKGNTNMLVLPEFSNDLHTLRMTFWATNYGSGTSAVVGVITDISDTSTFEVLGDAGTPGPRGSENAGNGNLMGPFDFNNVEASSGRIAILFNGPGTSSGWNIDDITVTFIPACAEPTGLANVNVAATSADITWNEADGSTYDLVYWENGGTDTTIIYGASLTDNVYTLTDLNPSSSYTWYVRTDCGDGTYALSYAQLTFSTPGLPVELPYERTFEEGEDNPVTEFTFQGTGDNQWTVGTATFKPEDADDPTAEGHSLYISNDNGVTNNYNTSNSSFAYAILNVSFEESLEYHLSFDYKTMGEGSSYTIYDYLSVYLMDASAEVPTNAVPSGTALLSQKYNVGDWTHADFLLENVTGTSKQIVFFWKNDYTSGTNPPAAIDNISIQGFSCAQPSNLTASNITSSSATLNWQENGSATAWNVYYRPVGGSEWSMETATEESLEITGLGSNTKYEFYITSDCSGEESNPSATAEFRTLCGNDGISVLPFSEDFEGEPVDGYVVCWTRSSSDSTGQHIVYQNVGEVWAWGSKALDFGYTPGCYTQATLPMFDNSIPLSTLMVEFDARKTGTDGAFLIGIMTDPEDDETFEVIDTILPSCIGSYYSCGWEHFTVYLNNYLGNGQYIAFRADNCGNSGCLIDNLVIDYLPECLPISNLYVSDLTMNGATISWSGNADSYNVYVGDNVYTTIDTFIVISDLNASSSYTVSVRALCAADSSVMSEAISFNTSCGAITVTEETPWFEDFEGYTSSSFVCWETPVTYTANNGTFPLVYRNYGEACHSGVNSTEFKGTECMLVLPEFSNDINTLRLSFWATATSVSTGHIQIGVITNVTDTSTFELLIADAGTPGPRGGSSAGNGNFMGPFDLNGATATSGRIALRYIDPTGTGLYPQSWNVDDFTVELVPDCPSPVKTSVTATNIDGHNATISWTDNDPTHTAWIVFYKASTETDWNFESASATTLDLTGLDPETTYDVYVITDCGTTVDNPDATLTIHFTTLIACPAPQDLMVSNIGLTSATLTWFSNADNFTIEYGEAGFTPGNGTTVNVTGNTYDLNGLTSGTAYTVYISADCGADGTSSPAMISFMTACETVVSYPYTDGFENGLGCWVSTPISGSSNWITTNSYNSSSTLPEGSSCVVVSSNTHGYQTELASPIFDLTSLTNPYLSFYHIQAVWSGDQDNLFIYYKTSPSAPYELLTSFTDDISTWQLDSIALPNPTSTYQLIFKAALEYGHGIGLDNVMIYDNDGSAPGACNTPTNLTVNNITENSAVASWTAGGDETAWNLQYKEAASFNWGTTIPCTQPTYTFTDLAANTQYVFRVQADCGDNVSSWTDVTTFTTSGTPVITDPTVATNAANPIEQTTATLNATITNPDNVTITAKGFEWKATAGGTYTSVAGTGTGNNFSANLSGLTANTGYTYKAFITFNGTTVYGSEMTFTTLPEDTPEPCETPTNLHASEFDAHSITIGWNANANATSWNIRYRVENGSWTSATSNTNTYVMSGLTAETVYEIQVQANCGNGNLSEWCEPIHISTSYDGINSWLENSVSLFPNPAREYIDIRVDGDLNITMLEVYDVYGKLINTVNVVDNPTRINVSGLASGMYFVRVTMEKGTVTKTFVKK